MFKLVIQDDEGKTTVVPLIRDEITIGRKEGNTIRLTERNVSRRHARILRSNGSITIEDLDSYNGIRVNGSRIQGKAAVSEADRVQIGDYLIEVRAEGQVSADGPDTISDEAETRPIPTTMPMPALENGVDPMATTPVPEQATRPMPKLAPEAASTPVAAPAPTLARPARVVVLSTNFAGQEWSLDKPRMVIGRTDENDVWINHRSISRHHAELVQENGRWSIVDLQSSNGVRVNGEDYGKVELRRGDIVDLGHVRLRFVEAGEDFVFGRDAQAVDISGSGGKRSTGLVLIVALLLGVGAAAFALMSRDGGSEKAVAGSSTSTRPVVAAVFDAGGAAPQARDATSAEENPAAQIKDNLSKARDAIAAESWAEAEKLAKEVLELQPGNTEASTIEQKALLEKSNQIYFEEFHERAAEAKPNFEEAVSLYQRIADESIYKERARADYDKLKAMYLQEVKDQAEALVARKRCGELKKLKATARLFPDAEAMLRPIRCTEPTAVVRHTPPPNNTYRPPAPAKIDVAAELSRARRAAMGNQWGAARNACEAILKQEPGNVDARSICLLAACSLKRAKSAKMHYQRLPSSRKSWAVQQCFNQGVQIGP